MTTVIAPMHREEQRMLLKRLHTIGVCSVSSSDRIRRWGVHQHKCF